VRRKLKRALRHGRAGAPFARRSTPGVVEAADVGVADELLRHGAGRRSGRSFRPAWPVEVDADLSISVTPRGFEQAHGSHAIGNNGGAIHHDFKDHGGSYFLVTGRLALPTPEAARQVVHGLEAGFFSVPQARAELWPLRWRPGSLVLELVEFLQAASSCRANVPGFRYVAGRVFLSSRTSSNQRVVVCTRGPSGVACFHRRRGPPMKFQHQAPDSSASASIIQLPAGIAYP